MSRRNPKTWRELTAEFKGVAGTLRNQFLRVQRRLRRPSSDPLGGLPPLDLEDLRAELDARAVA